LSLAEVAVSAWSFASASSLEAACTDTESISGSGGSSAFAALGATPTTRAAKNMSGTGKLLTT